MDEEHRWLRLSQSSVDEDMLHLDHYLAMLYEDHIQAKVEATRMVLLMMLKVDCLGAIAYHVSAVGALARVLRDDCQRSPLLKLNIMSIFFVFSFFRNFHQIFLEHQIGRTTLLFLELEFVQARDLSDTTLNQVESGEVLCDAVERDPLNLPLEDQLLYVSVHLLLNLAEDLSVEKKMRKCNLVSCLCKMLNKRTSYLLTLVISFLKKLSMFQENIDAMKENAIAAQALPLLEYGNETLSRAVLGLLLNLSFDENVRSDMGHNGVIHILELFLEQQVFEHLVWGLLYNLSQDLELRLKIAESEIYGNMLKLILAGDFSSIPTELVAFAINVTYLPHNAKITFEPPDLEKFISHIISLNDPLFFKVLRNLGGVECTKCHLLPFVPTLVKILMQAKSNIQVEIMGMINNMKSFEQINDTLLLDEVFLRFLREKLHTSNKEDDLNLEVSNLGALFLSRRHDVDISLQSMFTFYRIFSFNFPHQSADNLLDEVINGILHLSQDSNDAVATAADYFIDTMSGINSFFLEKIRKLRFMMYQMCHQNIM